jgi:hypothetical protein
MEKGYEYVTYSLYYYANRPLDLSFWVVFLEIV